MTLTIELVIPYNRLNNVLIPLLAHRQDSRCPPTSGTGTTLKIPHKSVVPTIFGDPMDNVNVEQENARLRERSKRLAHDVLEQKNEIDKLKGELAEARGSANMLCMLRMQLKDARRALEWDREFVLTRSTREEGPFVDISDALAAWKKKQDPLAWRLALRKESDSAQ